MDNKIHINYLKKALAEFHILMNEIEASISTQFMEFMMDESEDEFVAVAEEMEDEE